MKYKATGIANAHQNAEFSVKSNVFQFGITKNQNDLANPAELLMGSFAACCLKNIERFSEMMKFNYKKATVDVVGTRQDSPPKIISIDYEIKIYSNDEKLNVELLHKNLQKFGTIYNTLKEVSDVKGKIILVKA